ncbi:hypothetical protein CAT7_05368 [Carnobacterium sp. AT7]|uniref:hypothetical protein n=1 Tax=Carnobacterium TaxID=2747 RepID=UPI00015F1419|nr:MULTISPECIES: hypothetical protein [Carnobacterium]EDP67551.1 hypothetical protein CAT7_05368 [Carnobacterium sp. AT7]
MGKKYVLKGLSLFLFIPLTINYFIKTPFTSDISLLSVILVFGITWMTYEEVRLFLDHSDSRSKSQMIIDRAFLLILISMSIDTVVTFFIN